jgi:hypothetical protein
MDLAMPGGNGDEAIATLKADLLTRDIPVIVSQLFSADRLSIVLSPPARPKYSISPLICNRFTSRLSDSCQPIPTAVAPKIKTSVNAR